MVRNKKGGFTFYALAAHTGRLDTVPVPASIYPDSTGNEMVIRRSGGDKPRRYIFYEIRLIYSKGGKI